MGMTTIDSMTELVEAFEDRTLLDEARLAAAAYLARYSGRTLDAYRHDLRTFFQWAADMGLAVLDATRPHIELYRATLERRGLAASTIDRRLSTVCGFYRFAHIDGRVASNPAQYVRRPKVYPTEGHGMDPGELGRFLFTVERFDRSHAALAVLLGLNGLRVSEACAANSRISVWNAGIEHCVSSARETSLRSFRWCRAQRGPSTWPLANGTKGRSWAAATVSASTGAPLTVGCARLASEPD
jgi:integrase